MNYDVGSTSLIQLISLIQLRLRYVGRVHSDQTLIVIIHSYYMIVESMALRPFFLRVIFASLNCRKNVRNHGRG